MSKYKIYQLYILNWNRNRRLFEKLFEILYAPIWYPTNRDDAKAAYFLRPCCCVPLAGDEAAEFTDISVGLRMDGGKTCAGEKLYLWYCMAIDGRNDSCAMNQDGEKGGILF